MERFIEGTLRRWLERRRRKPLVLRGARQVGKTTLVRQFAAAAGMGLCEVNLERNLYLDDVFKSLDTGRLVHASWRLEALGGVRLAGSILFLDEVQAAPHALLAMRYLYEDRPEIPVLAAGSLLEFALADHSFSMPVGRIEYLHMGPMSFGEFLRAVDPALVPHLEALSLEEPPADAAHRLLQTVRHAICIAADSTPVKLRILSLPLYAVEALPGIIDRLRTRQPGSPA
ncbi:MAG: AAA family ATPase [Spirochaetaceae bacterium]|nr:AAA family ATPase [Spirochaetaceae bacterium]